MIADAYGLFFWGNQNILELDTVMVVRPANMLFLKKKKTFNYVTLKSDIHSM